MRKEKIYYTIYPCSYKIELSNKEDNMPVAFFENEGLANKICTEIWEGYGEVKPITAKDLAKLITKTP